MSGDDSTETVTFGGSNIEYDISIDAPSEIELGDTIDVTVTLTGLDGGGGYAWIELAVNNKRLPERSIPSFISRLDAQRKDWGTYIEVVQIASFDSVSHTFTIDTTDDRFYELTEDTWDSHSWGAHDAITATSRRFWIQTGPENEEGIRTMETVWQNGTFASADVDLKVGRRTERHIDDMELKAMDQLGEHADFSRTSWQQLKPVARDDLTEGTRAEVYDPLWLLGRQWQVGEFDGEDAGSPVRAELFYDTDDLNEYDPAPNNPTVEAQSYDLSDGPLEAMVEREPVVTDDDGPGLEVAAEAGQYFLRLLDEHGYTVPDENGEQRPPTAADYPNHQLSRPDEPLDAAGRRYTTVVDGRTVDGAAIYEAAVTQGMDVPCPTADSASAASSTYQNALQAFTDWYADLYDEPTEDEPSPWTPDRMEYQFAVATGEDDSRTDFQASDYTGGRLDWYAFDVDKRDEEARFEPPTSVGADDLAGTIEEMNAARNTLRAVTAAESSETATDTDWQAEGVTESAPGREFEMVDPLFLDSQVSGETMVDTTAIEGYSGAEPAASEPVGLETPLGTNDDEIATVDLAETESAAESALLESLERFDTMPGSRNLADEIPDADVTPTKVSYPGMPSPRFWEFEDGNVNLKQMKAGPGELGKTLMLEYATLYGNDWFQLNIDVPLGSLARVTGMTVTDTFGEVTSVPATGNQTDEWGMFTFDDLPKHENPGLFLPPVLSTHEESDTVEEVVFTRDEMANLAFAIETTVEDPIGDPLKRVEFQLPAFDLDSIEPDPDPTAEYLEFHNRGEDIIDVSEWEVAAELAIQYTTQSATQSTTERRTVFEFPSRNEADTSTDVELGPDEAIRIYTADPKGIEPSVDAVVRHAGKSEPVWNAHHSNDVSITRGGSTFEGDQIEQVAISVVVEDSDDNPTTVQPMSTPVDPSLSDYWLATDVEDYWFPMKPIIYTGEDKWRSFEPSVDLFEEFKALWRSDILDMRFELAQLVDADVDTLPVPLGEILDVDEGTLRLYDEELTRAGLAVSRSYQRTRWVDGDTHLWSGRHVETGFGELTSELRYDVLEDGELPEVEGVE